MRWFCCWVPFSYLSINLVKRAVELLPLLVDFTCFELTHLSLSLIYLSFKLSISFKYHLGAWPVCLSRLLHIICLKFNNDHSSFLGAQLIFFLCLLCMDGRFFLKFKPWFPYDNVWHEWRGMVTGHIYFPSFINILIQLCLLLCLVNLNF